MIVTLIIPETIDQVCRRVYGDESDYVEPVLAANPGLAAKTKILPVGTAIDMPEIATTETTTPVVTLWD
ncbi:tail protein X [Limimaricola hongkongensis]|uniref:Phage tail X n=1 Tax=Limimaricola hongkongensis DSM 17492 TaxID=1122180 RepID=A0A017HBX9_9RHOB|nr:tail protein X [Limimaricola hongkongensis]EYD71820.1 phage tail X [Limimaricola hongkongensis DSM 17492]